MSNFEISFSDNKKIDEWLSREVYPAVIEQQREQFKDDLFLSELLNSKDAEPYTGMCGGNLTYSFTPIDVGVILKVKECISGKELDLTDYESF
jgi:hypothetical protein